MNRWIAGLGVVLFAGGIVGYELYTLEGGTEAPEKSQEERIDALESALLATKKSVQAANAGVARNEARWALRGRSPDGALEASEDSLATAVESADHESTSAPALVSDVTEGLEAGQRIERENLFFDRYFGELEQELERRAPAPELTQEVAGLIAETLTPEDPVEIVALSCRQDLCRVEAQHRYDRRAERDEFVDRLHDGVARVLGRASIHVRPDQPRIVAYFTRAKSTRRTSCTAP